MATNDYSTTSCSEQYFNMFIRPDQEAFAKGKKETAELQTTCSDASEVDRLAGISLYSAKGKYATALDKNASFNKRLDDLRTKKKLAEDNARKAALANGMSMAEADDMAEMAGKSVQKEINRLLYGSSPQIAKSLAQNKTLFEQATETNTTAHSQYMSASLDLDRSLFDQQMRASDINKNMGFYTFLKQAEQS